jgi:hypothetical protein
VHKSSRNQNRPFLKPESSKAWAVWRVYFIIIVAYGVAFSQVFGLPKVASLLVHEKASESEKTVATISLGFLTTAISVLVSGASIKGLVESAIEDAAEAKVNDAKEELRNYKEANSSDKIVKRQIQEFKAIIFQSKDVSPDELDTKTGGALRDRIARQVIKDKVFNNKGLIEKMTLSAAMRSFPGNLSRDDATGNYEFNLFLQDLRIYLKAWLMFSIEQSYPMDVEEIEQQINNKDLYINALEDIKNRQIRKQEFSRELGESYDKEFIIDVLDKYLDLLISKLCQIRSEIGTT